MKKNKEPQELNQKNRLITRERIQRLLNKYGIKEKIQNLDLYQRAFVHKSYLIKKDEDDSVDTGNQELDEAINAVPFQPKTYERLEYIGDFVLNSSIGNYLAHRFPEEEEGFLTELRTKLVRSKTLAILTRRLRLHKYILLSKYVEERCGGRINPSILEDVFEALIGAIFMDFGSGLDDPQNGSGGFNVAQRFVLRVFESHIDISALIGLQDNYKRVLLEYYQKRFHVEPKYQTISMRGPTSNRSYTMGALSPTGEIIGIGIARKKTEAEQVASKRALEHYGEEVDESESETSSDDEGTESE